jgi:H+/Cl- antiporter ClcA
MDIYHYIQAAVTMTAVTNPMVAGVMLLQMEAGRSNRDKISLTVKTTAITTAILVGSAIMGQMILKFFGISLEVFRIVGGLIIAYIGFRMLSGQMLQSVDVKESNSLNDLIMFMASPGSIATAITLGWGGSGGIFAPCLVIGSLSGIMFYKIFLMIFPSAGCASEGAYALLGMAGVISGVMQAPLTGIFLIVEITGGYETILPLIVVSSISSTMSHYIEPASFYFKESAFSLNFKNIICSSNRFEVRGKDVPFIPFKLKSITFTYYLSLCFNIFSYRIQRSINF